MQIDAKKQIEIVLMDYFRQSFSEFPAGRIVAAESPDFILRHSVRRATGIELTRLHSSNIFKSPFAVPEESPEMRFIRNVENLVQGKEPRPLFAKFYFDAPVDERRIPAQAAKTAVIIRREIENRNESAFSKLIEADELPPMLNSIRIMYNRALTFPVWEKAIRRENGSIIADIEESLKKKDEKLRIYLRKNLNQYWLLITADQLRETQNFNIRNLLENHRFSSGFNKVFLFELWSAQIFRIV